MLAYGRLPMPRSRAVAEKLPLSTTRTKIRIRSNRSILVLRIIPNQEYMVSILASLLNGWE